MVRRPRPRPKPRPKARPKPLPRPKKNVYFDTEESLEEKLFPFIIFLIGLILFLFFIYLSF